MPDQVSQPMSMPSRHARWSSVYRRLCSLGLLAAGLVTTTAAALPDKAVSAPVAEMAARLAASYGRLPLSFEPAPESNGDPQAGRSFVAHGQGYGLALTGEGAVLTLHSPDGTGSRRAGETLKIKLPGARGGVQPSAEGLLAGHSSYMLGNDSARWRTAVPNYAQVRYSRVYPGIDLVYYGQQRQLEHDFVVAPGGDPGAIRLRFEGASELRVDRKGNLRIRVGGGELALQRPVIYQAAGARRRAVHGGFRLLDAHTVGFALGRWDRRLPLVIDPVLSYASFLGGSDQEYALSAAVDSAGEALLAGLTWSVDFPTTPGAYQAINYASSANSVSTAFVCKLNPSGTALLYCTYLGGDGTATTGSRQGDSAHSIAVDAAGNAYVTGWTYSLDFPITPGAYQDTNWAALNGQATGFVAKLNPSGTALLYSTYLGGSNLDEPTAIALDSGGNAYIAGYTFSQDFPRSNGAFQTTNRSGQGWNAFVSKLNAVGTALVYSTYLGGSGESGATLTNLAAPPAGLSQIYAPISIAVDSSGDAFVAGFAASSDFPITAGAYQTANRAHLNAGTNLTLSKLNPTGSGLLYSTYIGGSSYPGDFSTGLAVDASGNAYLTGYTFSSDFPIVAGAYQTNKSASQQTAFATKVNPTGTGLVYSTFLGGGAGQDAFALALDGSGNLFLTGGTASANFPVTADAYQSVNLAAAGGRSTTFLSELNAAGSALLYSTLLGGSVQDGGYGLALGSGGAVFVAGTTASPDFPATSGALENIYHSSVNTAFAARFDFGAPSSPATQTNLQASANPQNAGTAVTFTATVAPLSGTAVPGGNLIFSIDEAAVATVALDANGQASYQTGNLAAGPHYVLASYQGNGSFASSGDGLTEQILPPPPAITSLAPFAANAGGAGFTLTINGANFYSGITVQWNGTPLSASYIGPAQLTAQVSASLIAGVGTAQVTIASTGGTSAPLPFTILPAGGFPLLLSLSPASAIAAGNGFMLTINGANFAATSKVLWNGGLRATSYVSSSQLTATIPASDIAQPGTGLVSVATPAPNAATAAAQPFWVTNGGAAAITGTSVGAPGSEPQFLQR